MIKLFLLYIPVRPNQISPLTKMKVEDRQKSPVWDSS